jgi:hypothetical protein
MLLLIRMSFDAQSASIWDRRAARQAQSAARLTSWSQQAHTTKHKSCHRLLLICMSFNEQIRTNQNAFSLCEKGKDEKRIHTKEFFANVVALPNRCL